MHRLIFVPLSCHFLTLCQHFVWHYHALSFKTLTSACGVGIILTPLLPPGKLRHREFKGLGVFLRQVWRSWSPDLGSLIPGLELLATVSQSELTLSLVCHKEGGPCSHDFFPGYQSAIVLGGENLDSREEGERKGGQSQDLGPPGHLGGVSLHPRVDPLGSWHDDGPGPGTRAPVASAVATFVD